MSEKIQKVLANAGLGSRRQIEGWIEAGRVSVNGVTAKIGDRINLDVAVSIDGRPIKLVKSTAKKTRVLIYNKPEGEICTRSDPEKRPTVFMNLPLLRNSRWIVVGRLDINTQGLLLFTNNGALANQLMHPRNEMEREYAVRVRGAVTPEIIKRFQQGIELDDGSAHFEKIIDAGGEGSNRWYHVVVKEGRNRLVRRLFESQDLEVSRLMRVRFGVVALPKGLKRGQWREMELGEINDLMESVGLGHSSSE